MLKTLLCFVLVAFMVANVCKIVIDIIAMRKAKKTYEQLVIKK